MQVGLTILFVYWSHLITFGLLILLGIFLLSSTYRLSIVEKRLSSNY